MTNITELAQSLKAAAIDAKELAIIARYSKGRAAAEKFYALANPANILALVEALEKAQQRITQLESRAVKLPAERFCPAEYAGSQLWSETEVWNKAITACADELRAAGIKVEAE
ncbi:TPA: ead/Ea22-like family protein [Klebsiella pneumoniae]|uniref:ead/Ea22-like family protein n=1 Tax=Klebsiella pneumoniae TaxID=573 RepID=UPI000E2D2B13|nr:ead/Ea22-like family protein [Klebsiella pneumoniae]MBY8362352.1 ead/Ea22-like family protein [Klebsiella pneumoniae]SVS98014.1 Ead domain protein [Klebsiella pneumoniae]SWU15033.1 Ead domain protein [Klebsiella pneumoniae]HCI9379909.1 ead/Ea22-like family protein [Klebsiella pneumoniae]HCI9836564.1 ead/Ea22-like family protein [Klebsiella pneumoniae]